MRRSRLNDIAGARSGDISSHSSIRVNQCLRSINMSLGFGVINLAPVYGVITRRFLLSITIARNVVLCLEAYIFPTGCYSVCFACRAQY